MRGLRRAALLLAVVAAVIGIGRAQAGRRLLAWPYDTETLPDHGVELEQWIWEEADAENPEAWLWWAVVVGVTDQLELALPLEWQWQYGLPTQLEDYGVDVRWRIAPRDGGEDAWPVAPLLRAGVKRHLVNNRNAVALELDAVVSTDIDRLAHFVIDAGVKDLIEGGDHTVTVDLMAGGTVLLGEGFRVGGTVWAQLLAASPAGGTGLAFIAAGPDISWSHGRFWVTAGVPIRLTSNGGPGLQPRLTWGVLF
jgi:hypothetical protein